MAWQRFRSVWVLSCLDSISAWACAVARSPVSGMVFFGLHPIADAFTASLWVLAGLTVLTAVLTQLLPSRGPPGSGLGRGEWRQDSGLSTVTRRSVTGWRPGSDRAS